VQDDREDPPPEQRPTGEQVVRGINREGQIKISRWSLWMYYKSAESVPVPQHRQACRIYVSICPANHGFQVKGRNGKHISVLEHYAMDVWGSEGTDPAVLIPTLLRWRVVNFTPLPLWTLERQSQSQSHVKTDGRSISQSVWLSVKSTLVLVTRYYFLSESCWVDSVGGPLWWEVESVSCQSLSTVFSPLSKI
jgi:hypothetical protein